jgi:hypothetical protein
MEVAASSSNFTTDQSSIKDTTHYTKAILKYFQHLIARSHRKILLKSNFR